MTGSCCETSLQHPVVPVWSEETFCILLTAVKVFDSVKLLLYITATVNNNLSRTRARSLSYIKGSNQLDESIIHVTSSAKSLLEVTSGLLFLNIVCTYWLALLGLRTWTVSFRVSRGQMIQHNAEAFRHACHVTERCCGILRESFPSRLDIDYPVQSLV